MAKSSIEWTDETWNPVTGCTRASNGCDNCYAVKMTKRLDAMGQEKYKGLVNIGKDHFNGVVKCHEDALELPLRWKRPRKVFVNSMSDLFHKDVPFEFVDKCFAIMALCPQHTFQILTKRPERMAEYFEDHAFERGFESVLEDIEEIVEKSGGSIGSLYDAAFAAKVIYTHEIGQSGEYGTEIGTWPLKNVWLGTSVEDQKTADERIPHLLRVPAKVRFLSCEPLLGYVDLTGWFYECREGCTDGDSCSGGCAEPRNDLIHWVITGGESGPNARPMNPDWARSLRDQCKDACVAYFFKQWGEWVPSGSGLSENVPNVVVKGGMMRVGKKAAGRLLDGVEHNEFPEVKN